MDVEMIIRTGAYPSTTLMVYPGIFCAMGSSQSHGNSLSP
jgi:hypothetical protein